MQKRIGGVSGLMAIWCWRLGEQMMTAEGVSPSTILSPLSLSSSLATLFSWAARDEEKTEKRRESFRAEVDWRRGRGAPVEAKAAAGSGYTAAMY